MATQPKHYFTVEQYLEQEEQALDRHEYFNGDIFAMAGGTDRHADISANLVACLHRLLLGGPCKVRGSDMRLRTRPSGLYSYADAVVCCANAKTENNTLLNPVVILEVQSPSTKDWDRGGKFEEYRRIDSFQEYVIVAQDRRYAEHHVRGDNFWTMREYKHLSDAIPLDTVGVILPLEEIYQGLSFPDSGQNSPGFGPA